MHIIYDRINDEYGLLEQENFKDSLEFFSKKYNNKKINIPDKTKAMTLPVIKFYDRNKKCYDRAYYTSDHAKSRYEIIKEVDSLDQYFSIINNIRKE